MAVIVLIVLIAVEIALGVELVRMDRARNGSEE